MPDHWKEIASHAPLFAIGMVVGRVDAFIASIPVTVRILAVVIAVLSGYYEMRGDIKVLQSTLMNCKDMHTDLQRSIERLDDKKVSK